MDVAVLVNPIDIVFRWNVAGLSWLAVAAESHSTASNAVIPASCLVNRASFIGNVIFMNPLVCIVCVSTVAAVIFLLTGNQNLGCDVNIGPCSLTCNFYSVWEGGRCRLGPARAAVLRNVLVLDVRKVVYSIHWTPVERLWKLVSGEVLKNSLDKASNIFGWDVAGCVMGTMCGLCGCNEHYYDRFHVCY